MKREKNDLDTRLTYHVTVRILEYKEKNRRTNSMKLTQTCRMASCYLQHFYSFFKYVMLFNNF